MFSKILVANRGEIAVRVIRTARDMEFELALRYDELSPNDVCIPTKERDMAFTSVKEVFEKMPAVFNAAAATGLNVVFQFHITGGQAGDWNVAVANSACEVCEGVHAAPTVSLTMADEDWLAMCNGTLDGMTAFMSGKLKASGDIMSAQRIPSLFPMG